MLKLENISKSFGDVRAVCNVSLEVEEGEIFVLLGPTGAGKTTTLKIAAGLIKPDEGKVYIDGQDVSNVPPAFRNVSFVFENYNLFPIYNVYDNIAFALRSDILRVKEPEIKRRIQSVSRDLYIENLLTRTTNTLSGGETQRVALARALVRESRLNLFDEPLSNLDLKLREELRVEFKELHKKYHSTIFYVTHDHDSAVTIAQRIAVISQGFVHQIDTPENLLENPEDLTVARIINYPTINVVDCFLHENSLSLNGKTSLVELSPQEMDRIRIKKDGDFQLGLKPKKILLGRNPQNLNFTGKFLNTEYQGYNKVINIDYHELTIRVVTTETPDMKYGDSIEFNFSKQDMFLFSKTTGLRVL